MSRRLTVLAQDPSVLNGGRALTTQVAIPDEVMGIGPRGSRIEVVDYDASADVFYGPYDLGTGDSFAEVTDIEELVSNPVFHAQNTYGIVAATLHEFERALGRYLSWGFEDDVHQIKVFPHAFREPNAFYSKRDECLAFGYFKNRTTKKTVYTCLSHDIVAHETAHALLDGLRGQLMRPSSYDQAAFHEGFADVIALLMVLKNEEMVGHALSTQLQSEDGTISAEDALDYLKNRTFLTGLGEHMGSALFGVGRDALRRSAQLEPSAKYYTGTEYREPHDRGEILVAAVMNALLAIWHQRLQEKFKRAEAGGTSPRVAPWRIVEEGAKAAEHLLRIMIRAVDYLPPVHVEFGDFLSAAITADWEIYRDDTEYHYREQLLDAFKAFGIKPASENKERPGVWQSGTEGGEEVRYDAANTDALRWNREAIFQLLWKNYEALGLKRDVFTRVSSVRPVWRVGADGFVLRETVAEYYQLLKAVRAEDLEALGIEAPAFMNEERADVVGGGALIFDEFGRLKYHVHNRLESSRQKERLSNLRRRQASLIRRDTDHRRFLDLHRRRAIREPQVVEGAKHHVQSAK